MSDSSIKTQGYRQRAAPIVQSYSGQNKLRQVQQLNLENKGKVTGHVDILFFLFKLTAGRRGNKETNAPGIRVAAF